MNYLFIKYVDTLGVDPPGPRKKLIFPFFVAVTRLVQFSPIVLLLSLGPFLKVTEAVKKFWLLFSKVKAMQQF
jgi:hypothetical protein